MAGGAANGVISNSYVSNKNPMLAITMINQVVTENSLLVSMRVGFVRGWTEQIFGLRQSIVWGHDSIEYQL